MEFEGRVISCDPSHGDDGLACKSVVCEDVAGYLNDSRQPYTEERLWEGGGERTGLQEFVDYVLDNHNKRMPEHKRVYRGTVDVPTFATVDNVTKGTNFERTLDLISDKLVGVFGGEWMVRRGEDGRLYLDYRTVLGSVSRTPIAIGHNIASAADAVDPNGLITRLTRGDASSPRGRSTGTAPSARSRQRSASASPRPTAESTTSTTPRPCASTA